MSWPFVICDRNGNAISQPIASRRQYNPAISTSETASFGVQIGSPLWDQIQAYDTMLKVYDSFQNLQFYGEILSDELVGSGQGGTVEVSAVDVSFRLSERFAGKDTSGVGLQYVNQDARAIAFDLLGRANAEAATGIVAGAGNVGLSTAPPFVPAGTVFGKSTLGAAQTSIQGDYYHGSPVGDLNKQVSKFTLSERAQITSMEMDIQGIPGQQGTYTRLVVYSDNAGVPGDLIAQSSEVRLNASAAVGGEDPWPWPRQWRHYSIVTGVLEAGSYWLGYIGGETSGSVWVGYDGGGTLAKNHDPYNDGATATFGAASTEAKTLAIRANITTAAPTTPSTFVGPTVTYLWKNLLDAISELGALADSYEWKLRYVDGTPPTVFLDLVPSVGDDASDRVFFEYGTGLNNCSGFRRIRSQQRRATRVYALGTGQTLTAVAFDTATESGPFARAEDVLPVGDITSVTLLDALAAQHVAIRKTPRTVASLTLAPRISPPYGEWSVGDYVTARAKVKDTVVVDGVARVWGASIQIDEEGNENAQPTIEATS